jgi:ABC-type transport system involved in multi-copper enzyme maturation permease subunit
MLTLIRREIRDHIVYFIAAVVFSAILIALLTAAMYHFESDEFTLYFGLSIPMLVILVLGFSAMGVTQMYMDRNRRISAFLSALPVTRSRILAARIIAGLLAILTVLVPLTITSIIMGRLFAPPIPIFAGYIADIFTTVFLMVLACYCLGLLTGWTANKITPTFGALGLDLVLVSLVFVKGFGPDIKFLLVLVIVACLIRTWHKFISTSL